MIIIKSNSDGGGNDDDVDHSNQVLKVSHVVSIKFLKDLNPSLRNFLEFFLVDI